jgi:PhnB protein
MQVNPYLLYNGNCEEAFSYYVRALGARIEGLSRYQGTPAAEHVPPEWANKIMHGQLTLDGEVLMAADAPPGTTEKPAGFAVSLQVEDPAKAERMFAALADGGSITMPIDKTFWARRFGMCVDRFGIPWMINCE